MATNKHAQIRYKILDNCFRNTGRNYFIDDLLEECNNAIIEMDPKSRGVSLRQVQDDISFMESEDGYSIELIRNKEGKRVFYRYSDPKYSIFNSPIDETELAKLKDALAILGNFKGLPQFEWMEELITKLNHGVVNNEPPETIISFDSNKYLKGVEHLGTLYNAIRYKRTLNIVYQPFEYAEPIKLEFHPYFLKQYNNRWFVYGYSAEANKSDWNIALDRIVSIKETRKKYRFNETIDWEEYFEDIYGVTKPEKTEASKVKLEFYGKTGHYIVSKPIHGSQKAKWKNKSVLEVELDLMINFELEQLIMSYGGNIKVVAPVSLRKKIIENLKQAKTLYKTKS